MTDSLALPPMIGLACLWLLLQDARTLDLVAVVHTATAIPAVCWAAALLATAGSFRAIAQYDRIAHRHFDTGTAPGSAGAVGAAAIALGQALGSAPLWARRFAGD